MQRGACLSTSSYPPTTAVTWLSEARDTNSRKSTIQMGAQQEQQRP
jgi:hypothetical protein